jgi:hypothetical protein
MQAVLGGSFQLGRVIGALGSHTSRDMAADMETFFKANPVWLHVHVSRFAGVCCCSRPPQAPGADRAVQQAVEKIRSNAAWLERDEAAVRAALQRLQHEEAAKPAKKRRA